MKKQFYNFNALIDSPTPFDIRYFKITYLLKISHGDAIYLIFGQSFNIVKMYQGACKYFIYLYFLILLINTSTFGINRRVQTIPPKNDVSLFYGTQAQKDASIFSKGKNQIGVRVLAGNEFDPMPDNEQLSDYLGNWINKQAGDSGKIFKVFIDRADHMNGSKFTAYVNGEMYLGGVDINEFAQKYLKGAIRLDNYLSNANKS